MMRPGLLTVAIIVGLNAWNEFVIAVTFLQNDNNVTAIVKFYSLTGQYSTDWGEMLAAADHHRAARGRRVRAAAAPVHRGHDCRRGQVLGCREHARR